VSTLSLVKRQSMLDYFGRVQASIAKEAALYLANYTGSAESEALSNEKVSPETPCNDTIRTSAGEKLCCSTIPTSRCQDDTGTDACSRLTKDEKAPEKVDLCALSGTPSCCYYWTSTYSMLTAAVSDINSDGTQQSCNLHLERGRYGECGIAFVTSRSTRGHRARS